MISDLASYLTVTGDLILKEKMLTGIPKNILPLVNQIMHLDLRKNSITHLNSCISSLLHLRSLDLRNNI